MTIRITRRGLALGLAATMLVSRPAKAQRAVIRLIVPAAPGGAIDVIGRLYAQRLAVSLNQSWIIENKAGANNTIGAAEVAKAKPDGSTYLTNADIQIMARHVMRNVPYDPIADFTPISRFATSPLVLVGTTAKTRRQSRSSSRPSRRSRIASPSPILRSAAWDTLRRRASSAASERTRCW